MKAIDTAKVIWQEGFPTHERFGDIYFSKQNPLEESRHTFLHGVDKHVSQHKKTTVVELGFGSGLNLLSLSKLLQEQNIKNQVNFYSCEKYPLQKKDLEKIAWLFPSLQSLYQVLLDQYPPLVLGWFTLKISSLVTLHLYWGDVQNFVKELEEQLADFVFLDGHSPAQNPQMWHESLLKTLATKTKINGIVKSFSVAGQLRRTLQDNGFLVKKISGTGKKRSILFAQKVKGCSHVSLNTLPWFSLPKTLNKQKRKTVAIVGAGISGCSLAYFLLKNNFDVVLIDRHKKIAQEASGNLAGMVHPAIAAQPTALSLFSIQSFYFLVEFLKTLEGVDYQFCPMDFFYDSNFDRFENWKDRFLRFSSWTNNYFESEVFQDCIQMKSMLWLSPRSLCQALLQKKTGLQLLFHEQVASFQKENDQWVTYNQKNEKITTTDILVLANGKDFSHCVSSMPHNDPAHCFFNDAIKLKQGHVVYGKMTQKINSKAILNSDYYFIGNISFPWSRQKYFVSGADFSNVGDSFSLPEFTKKLNESFSRYIPQEWTTKHARRSVRCHSMDRLPIAGALPNFSFYREYYHDLQKGRKLECYPLAQYHENIFVLTGMGSRGLSFAPYSAKILSNIINQTFVSPSLTEQLHPARFYIRQLFKKVSR